MNQYGSSSHGYAWNAGSCCKSGGDDIAYVNAVVKDCIEKFNVDPSRVYLSGSCHFWHMSLWHMSFLIHSSPAVISKFELILPHIKFDQYKRCRNSSAFFLPEFSTKKLRFSQINHDSDPYIPTCHFDTSDIPQDSVTEVWWQNSWCVIVRSISRVSFLSRECSPRPEIVKMRILIIYRHTVL